jgi:hypothetical protein
MSVAGYVEFHRGVGGSATPHPASYTMTNGHLRLQALGVRLATFHQSGGTNEIAENLWVRQGWHNDYTVYALSGGYLVTSNSTAYASSTYYPGTRGFEQSGGTHIVRGTLFLQSGGLYPSGYRFSGGQLIVRDIHMLEAIFSQTGGSLTHTGILILTGGHWKHGWSSAPQTQDFGMLQLKAAQTHSTFTFSTGVSAMVRFAASAEMAWDPEARLVIQGWQGGSAGSRLANPVPGSTRLRAGRVPRRAPADWRDCANGVARGQCCQGRWRYSRAVVRAVYLGNGHECTGAVYRSGRAEPLPERDRDGTAALFSPEAVK